MTSKKLLVPGFDFLSWTGGQDFLFHLIRGLKAANPDHALHLVIPVVESGPLVEAASIPPDVREQVRLLQCSWSADALVRLAFRHGIDAVIPYMGTLGPLHPIPWVDYLYDFQHLHLPQNFDAPERARRDAWFRSVLEQPRVTICNSRAVCADAAAFVPGHSCEVVPLPFSPCPEESWFRSDLAQARRQYGIGERYFFIGNQFWVHKDHPTAFRAFRAFLAEGGAHRDYQLVCTGANSDWRRPDYANAIVARLGESGIAERVRLTGNIPKPDYLTLVRGATAVIQPTLFEGGPGGGSVYDAMALGTPALVSDIPINREIVAEREWLRFFPAQNPGALASRMREIADADFVRPPEAYLLAKGRERLRAFGEALDHAVDLAIDRHRRARG